MSGSANSAMIGDNKMSGGRMVRISLMAALALATIVGGPAAAEVRDAVYRGTMVCDKLPFTQTRMREAIDVTISDGKVRYTHIVRLRESPEGTAEQGTGVLDGQDIALQGAWDGGNRRYKASYSGTFVRRSARLKGTQIWAIDGKDVTRACVGSVKRPFKAFLPRQKKS
jgi:hypothetical protein